jgi:hypothetical protein
MPATTADLAADTDAEARRPEASGWPVRPARRSRLGRRLASLGVAVALLGAMACGGDDSTGDDPDDDLGEQAASAEARAVAEALRVVVLADGTDGPDRRRVDSLQENADDIPGEPDISGIADEDGDGLDDDGKVEITVDDEVACMTIADDGGVDVTGGAC